MVAPYQYVNPLQKNQYVMRTTEEIQEIIDSYPDNWTKKDFRGEGKLNKVVKKTLEHIARHRTLDLKQEMKGKTHTLGRVYRKILEPICLMVGKIK